jgi:predicted metal-dependent hydrolase
MLPNSVHPPQPSRDIVKRRQNGLPDIPRADHASLEREPQIMKFDWSEGALAEGLRLYEAGEFFTAHEAWETVWLGSPEPEKTFLQGLIQVTAALHHLQRNNPLGAMLLMQAALRRLDRYPAGFGGISVTLLCHDIRACLGRLEAGEPVSEMLSPRIRSPQDSA